MKFGKSLRRLRYGAWSAWYCDYKMLKKLIKQCSICCQENMDHHDAVKLTGVNRMRFFLSIRQEANKVSSLYSSTLDEWEKDFKQLVLQLDVHQRTRQNHQVPLDLVSKFTALCNILDRLRGFVLLNHLAFMKILKKYDKKAALGGYAPVRESCMETLQLSPFYASSRLANHLAEAECLAASLTNLTSPDARPQKDSFKCGICLGVLRAPVVLVCAHRFCWTCLASAHKSQTHPACPICRKEQSLDPNNYSVHGVLEAFVQLHFSVDDNSEDDVSVTPSNPSEAVVLTPQKLLDISRAQDGLQKQLQTVTNMQQEAQELDTDDDDDNDTNTEADDMVIESETCAPVYGAQDQSPMVAKSLEAGINAPDVEVDNAQDVEEEDEQDKEEATGDRSASVSIPPTVRAQNRIVRLPRFAHLLTHASVPGTFVALDIDETIHTCPHRPCQMMTERGLKAYQLILTSSPLYKDMPFAAKNRCTRILQAALAAKALVEPGGAADSDGEPRLSTADVIRALQAAGVFVFGLTARYAAQSAISRRELLSVGVDLTLCTPFPQGCVLRDESTDALYEDGVIFTNACEKGPVLDRFLARLFSQSLSAKTSPSSSSCLPSSFGAPPRIVFVDDRLSNCVSVARGLSTAAQLNVPVTAYHYTYATTGDDISQTPSESDSSEDVFDPAIVQCQIHHFLHTQEILEDPKASDMIAKFRAQQSAKANAVAALNAEKEKQSQQQEQLKQEQFEEEQKRKFKAEYMQQNALKNKDKATATPAKSSPSASSSSSGSSSSSSSSSLKHSASTALLSRVRGSPLSSFVNQSLAVSASGDGSAQCNLA